MRAAAFTAGALEKIRARAKKVYRIRRIYKGIELIRNTHILYATPPSHKRARWIANASSGILPHMTKKFSFMPLGDRIVVKPEGKAGEKKLASGIIIPETVDKERPAQGTVVAVGKGKYDDGALVPMQVKVGDTVLFSNYGGDEVKIDGQEYSILSESQILGIIK